MHDKSVTKKQVEVYVSSIKQQLRYKANTNALQICHISCSLLLLQNG